MKRLLTVTTLGASLLLWSGSALAQQDGAVINADGNSGTSSAGINPAVDADGPTVVYGDVNTGPGNTVIGPPISGPIRGTAGNVSATDGDAASIGPGNASAAPGTVTRGSSGTDLLGPDGTYSVTENTPSDVSLGDSGMAVPAPVYEEPIYEEPVQSEPVVADTTASNATSGDQDGDNYPDAQELEIGLDPYNPDTDGDGVADGDEANIYGTDPFYWDTDGDGLGDGQELYELRTDPLAFDGDGAATSDTVSAPAPETQALDASGSTSSAGDSDGDRLSDEDEAALGTDPGNPDSDGDGYYDGDEAALGTSPYDATDFPAT